MYQFPHNLTLSKVQKAIQGREEFRVIDKGDYLVVNYLVNFEDTFPDVVDEDTAIRRECRGLIFDRKGVCVSRPYHKFFNVNERNETQAKNIDWTGDHIVLEKLDGSFIRPFRIGGNILWGTKMGVTDVATFAEGFVNKHHQYLMFADDMLNNGKTPVFEFCSRQQRIVIDYPNDRLVLTAIRDIHTGGYMPYNDMVAVAMKYNIDYVRTFGTVADFESFHQQTRDLQDMEGYVIRFDTGHMYKMKADLYCHLHRTLDKLAREKDFIPLIADDKLDDVLPQLKDDIAAKITTFGSDFHRNVSQLADKLWWIVRTEHDNLNGSKKKFAERVQTGHQQHSDLMFKMWDNLNNDPSVNDGIEHARGLILSKIKAQCSTQTKVNTVRHLFGGINWTDYYRNNVDLDG
jgi:T4 RnlA family RNA ligase